jgi:hypothetical protein
MPTMPARDHPSDRGGDFAVAVTCIDGRTHEPLTRWARRRADVRFVDLVTEPGADATLAGCPRSECDDVLRRLRVSLDAHHPELVVIAGHDDCAANPVPAHIHRDQIVDAVEQLDAWGVPVPVVGVWIDADGDVEEIAAGRGVAGPGGRRPPGGGATSPSGGTGALEGGMIVAGDPAEPEEA